MRKSTYLDGSAALEEAAPRGASRRRDIPRSYPFSEIIVAVIQEAAAIVRRAQARRRQRRQARDIYDALRQLDDRTLRDLGFDRSEIMSVAAEVTGKAEYSRVRTIQASHGLRR